VTFGRLVSVPHPIEIRMINGNIPCFIVLYPLMIKYLNKKMRIGL